MANEEADETEQAAESSADVLDIDANHDNDDNDDDDEDEEPRWRKSSRAAAKRAFERIEHDIDIFEHLNDLGEEVSSTDGGDDDEEDDDEPNKAVPQSRRRKGTTTKRTGNKRTGTGRVTKHDKMLAAQAERRAQRMKRAVVDATTFDPCLPPFQSPSKTDPNLGPLRIMDLHTAVKKRVDLGAINDPNVDPELKRTDSSTSMTVLAGAARSTFGAVACLGVNSVGLKKGERGFKVGKTEQD